jgi:hypothetical protein
MKWIIKAMTSDTYYSETESWVSNQSEATVYTDEQKEEINETKYKNLERYWDNIWMSVGE